MNSMTLSWYAVVLRSRSKMARVALGGLPMISCIWLKIFSPGELPCVEKKAVCGSLSLFCSRKVRMGALMVKAQMGVPMMMRS